MAIRNSYEKVKGWAVMWEPLNGILGRGWVTGGHSSVYPGEPLRPLTFSTRAAAREWVSQQQERRDFRILRVVERLEIVG